LNLNGLTEIGVDRKIIRTRLAIAESTLSLKVNGKRPWTHSEIESLLALARERGAHLTYETLFPARRRTREDAVQVTA